MNKYEVKKALIPNDGSGISNEEIKHISPLYFDGFKSVKDFCKCKLNYSLSGKYWWGIRGGRFYFIIKKL